MKIRVLSVIFVISLLLSLCACGAAQQGGKRDQTAAQETTVEETKAVKVDTSSWNWVNGELDCYGYSDHGELCYMSYKYPDCFKEDSYNESGEQYRGYNYNPDNPDATANESPYGIYIYFAQGGYSARKDDFCAGFTGGTEEREIGGRKVYFGEMAFDENNGAYPFGYYVQYNEDDYARIFIILTDPEEDGAFRAAFEESISFTK